MSRDLPRYVDEFIDSLFPVSTDAFISDAFVTNADVNGDDLEAIRVPTLIAHTKDDQLASHDASKRAAERIPGARSLSLASGGHLILGQHQKGRDELARFFAEQRDRGADRWRRSGAAGGSHASHTLRGAGPSWSVAALEPNRALVLDMRNMGGFDWVWQFGLYTVDEKRTRLVSRSRVRTQAVWARLQPAGFLMTRRMLLGIKQRAEALTLTRAGGAHRARSRRLRSRLRRDSLRLRETLASKYVAARQGEPVADDDWMRTGVRRSCDGGEHHAEIWDRDPEPLHDQLLGSGRCVDYGDDWGARRRGRFRSQSSER